MMMNLFSIFDPSTSMLNMSWISLLLFTMMQPTLLWKNSSTAMKMKNKILSTFKKEILFSLKKAEKGSESMILMIFILILSLNFMALYPQIFSPTSHLSITLPISMMFWLSLMLFGWVKNTNHMLSHLVPQGTPSALMMFMVMIELVSNLIRPITLCVRLTANLIAGHLLMTLLGNYLMNLDNLIMPLAISAPLILTILESAVACIQSYVFMTLITLYTTEIKYW